MAKKTFRMEDRKEFIGWCRVGDIERVRQFIADGFPIDAPDYDHNPGLIEAAGCGHMEVVKLLLDSGAKRNVQGFMDYTALHKAAQAQDGPMVDLLLDHGVHPRVCDENGNTAAHAWMKLSAITKKKEGVPPVTFEHIEKMFAAGLPINQCNNEGQTLLHLAILYQDGIEIVDKLVRAGADLNLTNKEGQRVIHMAALGPRNDVLRYLVEEHGLPVNAPNRYGNTPLHIANWIPTIETILELGGDPNAQNNTGTTPFLMMVKNGNDNRDFDKLFPAYLAAGGDMSIPDFQGNTVESVAKKNKLTWVQQFLAARQADNAVQQVLKRVNPRP